MKLFKCNNCGQPVYFENYICLKCNAPLGFDPEQMDLLALEHKQEAVHQNQEAGFQHQDQVEGKWQAEEQNAQEEMAYAILGLEEQEEKKLYKYCSNRNYNVCNWLLPYDSEKEFCVACNLNHTIPNLSTADHLEKWSRIEIAKHRLVYSLLRFKLPIISKFEDNDKGIAFDFMADDPTGANQLLTGHDHGNITLNIAEADDVIREMARNQMEEVYRTLLGHFRHEIGHYYWERLIESTDKLQSFRQLFGDETADYGEALKAHYAKPHSNEWQNNFISAYASSHPWEDWAETWAHYLHIIDTMETAYSFGLKVKPKMSEPDNDLSATINIDPYAAKNFAAIMERWLPLSFVMNSLNRSMGMKDSYPFVITEAVKEKLAFIHETIQSLGV